MKDKEGWERKRRKATEEESGEGEKAWNREADQRNKKENKKNNKEKKKNREKKG